ncbi:MAG: ABA4-like family protein [Elainellaceae cyanobacterium]
MTIELLFNAANLFVLPFWALMVIAPSWPVTRRVMASMLPFVALAALYVYFFVLSITPESAQSFSSAGLSDIAALFADERVAATGWVHFLVMDLLAGRWIYQDGQAHQIFTRHSLALCLFAGPMGLLSHIVTRWIVNARRPASEDGAEPTEAAPSTAN